MSIDLSQYTPVGSLGNFGLGGNTSGVGYNDDTDSIYFVQNNAATIHEFARTDLSTRIRTIDLPNLDNGYDTEGLCYMGNNEWGVATENGGRYYIHVISIPEGTTDVTAQQVTVLAGYQLAANGIDNNSGLEGVCYDRVNSIFYGVGEGEQANTPRKFYKVVRPVNQNTSYTYNDAELVVTEPFDPEVAFASLGATGSQFDLSGITFHQPTGTVVILSHRGRELIQVDPNNGNVLSQIDISEFTQPEGVTFTNGDNLFIVGEPDEYRAYDAPIPPPAPAINTIPNVVVTLGSIYTATATLSASSDVFWFKEYGPEGFTIHPETGEMSWDTTGLPRGQGVKVSIGCSNDDGEAEKARFIIHVDNTGTSKIVNLGVDTVSPYIRIGILESIFNAGDTLIVPEGTVFASVTANGSYENTFADTFGGDVPAGTATQMTTIMSQGFTIIDGEAHDSIQRQDELLEILGGVTTPQPYVKWGGLEWKGGNRQAVICQSANQIFDLCGATDSGYAQNPQTFTEAAQPYGSVAAMYLQGDYTTVQHCYSFGQARYQMQFGNMIDYTIARGNILRMDEYHGDQPRGGLTHYSSKFAMIANNWVIDADQEDKVPFYKNYAGVYAFPATGNESYPEGTVFKANGALNCDLVFCTSDGNALTSDIVASDLVAWDVTNTITPQTGSTSAVLFGMDSVLTLDKSSFGNCTTYDGGPATFIRASNSTNDLTLSNIIFHQLGWNGVSVDDVGGLLSNTGSANGSSLTNSWNYGFTNTDPHGTAWTVSNLLTTNPDTNGWDYLPRIEEGSPLDALGYGANITSYKAPLNVLPNDTGWQDDTGEWCWPHPEEEFIAERCRSYYKDNLPVRNPTVGSNPVTFDGIVDGDRGFAQVGESFSEYIWGQKGRTVPPLRSAATATANGEVTFRIGRYRSTRRDTISKFNVYETSDLTTPVLSFTGLKGVLTGVSGGVHEYVIRAVDTTKISAFGANETGESGNSQKHSVTVEEAPSGGPVQLIGDMAGNASVYTLPIFPISASTNASDRALIVVFNFETSAATAITAVDIGTQALTLIEPARNDASSTFTVIAGYILESDLANIANSTISFTGASPSTSSGHVLAALVENVDLASFSVNTIDVDYDAATVDNSEDCTFTLVPKTNSLGLAFCGCSKTNTTWTVEGTYTQSGGEITNGTNNQGIMAYKSFGADAAAETLTFTSGLPTDKTSVFAMRVDSGAGAADTTDPIVTAPSNTELFFANGGAGLAQNDTGLTSWLATASATDETAPATPVVTSDIASLGDPIPAGVHTVTFSATDSAGNTGQDTAQLTVTETTVRSATGTFIGADENPAASVSFDWWLFNGNVISDFGSGTTDGSGNFTISNLSSSLGSHVLLCLDSVDRTLGGFLPVTVQE